MSFSDSPTVRPTMSLGVQSVKASVAGGGIVVAVSSTTGFGRELSSQSSDFGLCGDKMGCERGDLFSEVGVGSRQGDERRPIRGGGCREIYESGSRLLLHFLHCYLFLL